MQVLTTMLPISDRSVGAHSFFSATIVQEDLGLKTKIYLQIKSLPHTISFLTKKNHRNLNFLILKNPKGQREETAGDWSFFFLIFCLLKLLTMSCSGSFPKACIIELFSHNPERKSPHCFPWDQGTMSKGDGETHLLAGQ